MDPSAQPKPELIAAVDEPAIETPRLELWDRVRKHKMVQWGMAYLGAALALAQTEEFLAQTFDWSALIGRVLVVALIVGLPVAITVAWYHGHRGLRSISAGELTIISLLMLIGAVFFTATLRTRDSPPAAPAAAAAAPESSLAPAVPESASRTGEPRRQQLTLPNLVAVLPLANLSPDPENAFYANGMHAEIISQLTKLRRLNVIGRDSVLQYAENRPPLQTIADDLGAQSLLVGTFQFANGQIRVAMQLVDPATRANLWADEYQSPFADIFAVQSDIAMNVANALDAEFSSDEQRRIEKVPTRSLDAYALYLEAQAARFEEGGAGRAAALLDESVSLDPEFALGYAMRASVLASRTINTLSGTASASWNQTQARVMQDAERALDLDPDLGPAHAALAVIYQISWRWTEARRAFERAYRLTPSDSLVIEPYSQFLSYSGAHAEAIEVAERRVRLQPGDVNALLWLHVALSTARDPDSENPCLDVVAFQPNHMFCHYGLGLTLAREGNVAAADAEFRLTERLFGDQRPIALLASLAVGYSQIGSDADASRLVAELEALGRNLEIGAGVYAAAYLAARDPEKLASWLQTAIERVERREPDPGFIDLMNIRNNVFAIPLLDEPRFREMRAQLGTP